MAEKILSSTSFNTHDDLSMASGKELPHGYSWPMDVHTQLGTVGQLGGYFSKCEKIFCTKQNNCIQLR